MAYFESSSHSNLPNPVTQCLPGKSPSRVLQLCISKVPQRITTDHIYSLCNRNGCSVLRIAISTVMKMAGIVTALVEFETVQEAAGILVLIHEQYMLQNSCFIEAEFAQVTRLDVQRITDRSWDVNLVNPPEQTDLLQNSLLLGTASCLRDYEHADVERNYNERPTNFIKERDLEKYLNESLNFGSSRKRNYEQSNCSSSGYSYSRDRENVEKRPYEPDTWTSEVSNSSESSGLPLQQTSEFVDTPLLNPTAVACNSNVSQTVCQPVIDQWAREELNSNVALNKSSLSTQKEGVPFTIMLSNVNITNLKYENVFNLFCQYGNVNFVKFIGNSNNPTPDDAVLVTMQATRGGLTALEMLGPTFRFRNSTVTLSTSDISYNIDTNVEHKSFEDNVGNRSPSIDEMFYPPSCVLKFEGGPQTLTTEQLSSILTEKEHNVGVITVVNEYPLHFKPVPVPADGNSLFSSIASHVLGNAIFHHLVRLNVVNHIKKHLAYFNTQYCHAKLNKVEYPFMTFLMDLSQLGTFGEELCLLALAECYELQIDVYIRGSSKPCSFSPERLSVVPKNTVSLYFDGKHYIPLFQIVTSQTNGSLNSSPLLTSQTNISLNEKPSLRQTIFNLTHKPTIATNDESTEESASTTVNEDSNKPCTKVDDEEYDFTTGLVTVNVKDFTSCQQELLCEWMTSHEVELATVQGIPATVPKSFETPDYQLLSHSDSINTYESTDITPSTRCGFMISKTLSPLISKHEDISANVQGLYLRLANGLFLYIINVNGPADTATPKEKYSFYRSITLAISRANSNTDKPIIILCGDFNAQVGIKECSAHFPEAALFKDESNENGEELVSVIEQTELTLLSGISRRRQRWTYSYSEDKVQRDLFFATLCQATRFSLTRSARVTDLSDHMMLLLRVKINTQTLPQIIKSIQSFQTTSSQTTSNQTGSSTLVNKPDTTKLNPAISNIIEEYKKLLARENDSTNNKSVSLQSATSSQSNASWDSNNEQVEPIKLDIPLPADITFSLNNNDDVKTTGWIRYSTIEDCTEALAIFNNTQINGTNLSLTFFERFPNKRNSKRRHEKRKVEQVGSSVLQSPKKCVLVVTNISRMFMNCDYLYNIVCQYDDVLRIKFSPTGTEALIEISNPKSISFITSCLGQIQSVFGIAWQMTAMLSTVTTPLYTFSPPYEFCVLPSSMPSFKDFTLKDDCKWFVSTIDFALPASNLLRFRHLGSQIASTLIEEKFHEKGLTDNIVIQYKSTKSSSAYKTGFIKFTTIQEATKALIICNNMKVPCKTGEISVRLSFTTLNSLPVENSS